MALLTTTSFIAWAAIAVKSAALRTGSTLFASGGGFHETDRLSSDSFVVTESNENSYNNNGGGAVPKKVLLLMDAFCDYHGKTSKSGAFFTFALVKHNGRQ